MLGQTPVKWRVANQIPKLVITRNTRFRKNIYKLAALSSSPRSLTSTTLPESQEMEASSRQNSLKENLISYRKYQYAPLDPTPGSIRLLRLHAAPDASWPIRCSLFHTTFEDAPPYIALSYAWSDRSGS